MDWASLAISLLALGVSIWAIIEARKPLRYTVSKEAAEKRAHLLKMAGQIERRLQAGLDHAKELERFYKDRPGYLLLYHSLLSLMKELSTQQILILKAPTAIELAQIELELNILDPKADSAVTDMTRIQKPSLPPSIIEVGF
jgi:hypothetical protein